MSATPPEAMPQYSRATGDSRRPRGHDRPGEAPTHWSVPAVVLGCGLAGAALLVIAEFATLYTVHTATHRAAITSVTVSSHNSYAMLPIAALAALLTFGAARDRSRPALVGVGALGVIALLIALLGDLPDCQSGGILLLGGQYVLASASPSAGMYLETLGALLLLIAAGTGLLVGGPPPTAERPWRRRPSSRAADAAGAPVPSEVVREPFPPTPIAKPRPASTRKPSEETSSGKSKPASAERDRPASRRNRQPQLGDD
jgi:hypothetical protein